MKKIFFLVFLIAKIQIFTMTTILAQEQINVSAMDRHGVDLISLNSYFEIPMVSIGSGDGALGLTVFSRENGFCEGCDLKHSFYGIVGGVDFANGLVWRHVYYQNSIIDFYEQDGLYTPVAADGSTLVKTGEDYVLTLRDGTIVYYEKSYPGGTHGYPTVQKIIYPGGSVVNIHYKKSSTVYNPNTGSSNYYRERIQSITKNNGLQIKFEYIRNTASNITEVQDWAKVKSVIAVNNSIDYCGENSDICSFSRLWPKASIVWSGPDDGRVVTFTGPNGETRRFTMDSRRRVVSYKAPSSTSLNTITYEYDSYYHIINGQLVERVDDLVAHVTVNGETWDYGLQRYGNGGPLANGNYYTKTWTTGPTYQEVVRYTHEGSRLSVRMEDGTYATFFPGRSNRVQSVIPAGLFGTSYTYDGRGNILTATTAGLVQSYGYDATCINPLKCNQINWSKDFNNNQTDYTYYSSGLPKSVTMPADDRGIRPGIRYFYTQRYAYYKSSSGSYIRAATPIWLLVKESYCRNGAALGDGCANANDEVITTYEYGPDNGPNNLWLRSVLMSADGVSYRSCFGYDAMGNRISETKPKAGLTTCP